MRYLQDEEFTIASRFLFLSMARVVIQLDIEHIEKGPFKIKKPYLSLLQKMFSKATNERRCLRKLMKKRGIQVVMQGKTETFTTVLFLCRGKEELRNYFNPAIQKKVEVIIQELIQISLDHPRDLRESHDS